MYDAQGTVIVETLEDWGTFDTEACRDKAVHQTFQIGACSSPRLADYAGLR